jgi:DNA-binding transcriptional LysR family regulator
MNAIHKRQNSLHARQQSAFVTLARTRSFGEAGRELFPTHFATCHSLNALEIELACRLLNRVVKRIELTAVGEAFLHYAQKGLKNCSHDRQTVQDFEQWGGEQLGIGAGATLFQRLLSLVLPHLRNQQPNLHLTAKTLWPTEIATSLKAGVLAIALDPQPIETPELKFTFCSKPGWKSSSRRPIV